MEDRTGRDFGVDAHLVSGSIEYLVGYPDRKHIFNQNRHVRYSFVVVVPIMTEGRLGRRGGMLFTPAPRQTHNAPAPYRRQRVTSVMTSESRPEDRRRVSERLAGGPSRSRERCQSSANPLSD